MKIRNQFLSVTFGLCTTLIHASASVATALAPDQFTHLAKSCAAPMSVSVLRAVAEVESRFDPLALRDNTRHISLHPATIEASISQARQWIERGDSVDLGLMQINSGNLQRLHLRLEDAFDPCHSINAANTVLGRAYSAGSEEAERQAALLITLSRYNTGKPLAGVADGYAASVLAAQSISNGVNPDSLGAQQAAQTWNIWGSAEDGHASWITTAKEQLDFERAGAQTSDARSEGRAPASSSEKGEPYELFAYQESEPIKP